MSSISFEIIHHYGILSVSNSGWTKELNIVSWNGRDPKLDIRDWSEDHTKMSRGLTLSSDDVKALKKLLNGIDFEPKKVKAEKKPTTKTAKAEPKKSTKKTKK